MASKLLHTFKQIITMKNIYALLLFLISFTMFSQEVYHIKFSDEDAMYSVAVILNDDDTGLVRVMYIDSDCDSEMIEMKASVTETITGYIITCADPVYAGTTKKAKNYNPDTFILTLKDDDGWVCKNVDSAKTESDCSFMEVTGITNQDIFLRDFGLEFTK